MSSIRTLATTAALAFFVSAAAAQAVTVQLTQTTTDPINVGDLLSFDLTTSSDFGDVGGIQSQVTFNADVLRLVSVGFNEGFDFLPLPQNVPTQAPGSSGPTTVGPFVAGVFAGTAPSGAGTLATFNFEAVGLGSSTVTVEGFGNLFITDLSSPVQSLFNAPVSTSVTVLAGEVEMPAPVPLPAAGLMLLTGMAGMSAFRLRRKA